MTGNKTLFVTSLYSKLGDTKFGGRIGRIHHYLGSLKTILNMEQDFVIYTSDIEEKEIIESSIDMVKYKDNIRIILYDLNSHPNHEYFQEKLNGFNKIDAHRCYEIMHNKTTWMNNHINEDYDFIYWIDCGLSHGGLFPLKYRGGSDSFADHFKCSLFTPKVVENLNKCTDKITLLSGDQSYHLFDSSANDKFFTDVVKDTKYHIIGGMFGGPKSLVINLINEYQIALDKMIEFDVLHREEQLLSYLFMKDKDSYNQLIFTTWHHEDSDMAQYNIESEIYFYNIFENLNK